MAVSLSSMDGNGDASNSLTVADGKKRRPITAGMVIRTSNAKAFWMIEGIVREDVLSHFCGHPGMIKRLDLLLAHEVTNGNEICTTPDGDSRVLSINDISSSFFHALSIAR